MCFVQKHHFAFSPLLLRLCHGLRFLFLQLGFAKKTRQSMSTFQGAFLQSFFKTQENCSCTTTLDYTTTSYVCSYKHFVLCLKTLHELGKQCYPLTGTWKKTSPCSKSCRDVSVLSSPLPLSLGIWCAPGPPPAACTVTLYQACRPSGFTPSPTTWAYRAWSGYPLGRHRWQPSRERAPGNGCLYKSMKQG